MTPDEHLRKLIKATDRNIPFIAELLGYASASSLDHFLAGRRALPPEQRAYLKRYAELRTGFAESEEDWLRKNPPPRRGDIRCTRCSEALSGYAVWLELNRQTRTYDKWGTVPPEHRQGAFPFGPKCARLELGASKAGVVKKKAAPPEEVRAIPAKLGPTVGPYRNSPS